MLLVTKAGKQRQNRRPLIYCMNGGAKRTGFVVTGGLVLLSVLSVNTLAHRASLYCALMASEDLYVYYYGLPLPKIAHSEESLDYFKAFKVQDEDVFVVTYPKSGTEWCKLPLSPSEQRLSTRRALIMESENYLIYHGLMCPKESHSLESFQYFENLQFLDRDVICVLYPKSGTTWMQEIIPLLLNGGDLTPVASIPNWDRVPWLEEKQAAIVLDKLSSPRAMVSHMLYHLMPPSFSSSKAKVIYVTRNPKDVLVSSFYFHKMASFLDDPGTFEEFMDKFLAGRVLFGKWTDHVKSWRNTDLGDRILYITYEEMIEDLRGALKRMLNFLDRQMSEDALNRVTEHCLFKNMKNNRMSNYSLVPQEIMDSSKSPFLRKGIAGDWKNHFSPDLEAKFNAAIQEEMAGSGIRFPWDEE